MVRDTHNKADEKTAMRVQTKMFQQAVRAIGKYTMSTEDAKVLKPSTHKKPRLHSLGILTHMAMIRAKVLVKKEVQKDVALHILRSQNKQSTKMAKEILEQKRLVMVSRFANARRTTWSSTIKKKEGGIFRHEDETADLEVLPSGAANLQPRRNAGLQAEGGKVKMAWFSCGVCSNKVRAERKAFQLNTLGAKSWCDKCHKNRMAKEWLCDCGMLWYKCEKHARSSDKAKKEEGKAKNGKKRPLSASIDFETLSSEPIKGRPRYSMYSIKSTMLSPALKRKFSYLCTDLVD